MFLIVGFSFPIVILDLFPVIFGLDPNIAFMVSLVKYSLCHIWACFSLGFNPGIQKTQGTCSRYARRKHRAPTKVRAAAGVTVKLATVCHCRAWPGNPIMIPKTPVPDEHSRFRFCCCFPNHRKNFLPEHKASRRSDCLFPKTTIFRHGLKVQRRRLCRLRLARMTGYCKC